MKIKLEPIDADEFSQFGDVLQATGEPDRLINRGRCGRWHDRARLDIHGGRAGVSLFSTPAQSLPLTLDMLERHPEGGQCFVSMTGQPFLAIVAPDEDGVPGTPRAFITEPGQAISYARRTWHGVLTPLHDPGLFAVIDRIGPGRNLEEHWFDTPYQVVA